MWIEEISMKKRDKEKKVNKGKEENNMNEENKEKKMQMNVCEWKRWVCMRKMKDMSVTIFMNVNEEDGCDEIYIESEEKKWVKRFVIFKSKPLD